MGTGTVTIKVLIIKQNLSKNPVGSKGSGAGFSLAKVRVWGRSISLKVI